MSNDGQVQDSPASPSNNGLDASLGELQVEHPAPSDRRSLVMSVTGLGAALLVATLSIIPAPFAIGGPGVTYDTLSSVDGVPLVEIFGTPTYETTGELRLTTVEVARGGSAPFTLGAVLRGWLSPSQYVVPQEEVFGTPDQEGQFEQQSQQAWISSQEAAAVAALSALGTPVPAELEIVDIDPASHAGDLLRPGDVIISANNVEVPTFTALSEALAQVAPGDEVTIGFIRDGVRGSAVFNTLDNGQGEAIMGLWIDPHFDMPIDVKVQIDAVGGPSAGLMFSLGIMDKLTEQDELQGARIAGTGTIDADGDVGAIGGIVMKMHGAVAAGAEYFLAPAANCSEVVGNIPAGLSVFSVETLDDAYNAIVRIGANDTAEVSTCETY